MTMTPSPEDRKVADLRAQGKSWHEIARIMAANADGSDPELVQQLTDLQAQRAQLSNGAVPAGAEPAIHPQSAMIAEFRSTQAHGGNREESIAAGFEKLFEAAANGDERVASPDSATAKRRWAERQNMRAETTVSYRR